MGNSNEYQAYFLVNDFTKEGKPIIDGIIPLNAWHCGSCDKGQVYFVSWCKDGNVEAQDPHHATIVDFSLDTVEQRMTSVIVQKIYQKRSIRDYALPSVYQLVLADTKEGLTPDQIIEKRAGILGENFLGFTFERMVAENPWIIQPVKDEEGNERPNVWKCNLGPTVES